MIKKKIYELSNEELCSKIKRRWVKAESLEEVEGRAQTGKQMIVSKKCSLANILDVFTRYPEAFLYQEIVDRFKSFYKSNHTYMNGNSEVQEQNMSSSIIAMQKAAKSIYGDLENDPQAVENFLKSTAEKKQKERQSYANLFDEKTEENKVAENKKVAKQLSKSLKEMYLHDSTPIEAFSDDDGVVVKYLRKNSNVRTLGDLMKFLLDHKSYTRFSVFGVTHKENFSQFNKNVLDYINQHLAKIVPHNEASAKAAAFEIKSTETTDNQSFFEKLEKMPAEKFVKDSKEMEKISMLTSQYLNEIMATYLGEGFSEEEVNALIDEEIKNFHTLVDKKREENNKTAAAARIGAKIADGVKYKTVPAKDHEIRHSHNPFDGGKER